MAHPSQVLLPAWCQPRLADATEVVGAALAAKATGRGYRAIAAELGRAPATVRDGTPTAIAVLNDKSPQHLPGHTGCRLPQPQRDGPGHDPLHAVALLPALESPTSLR